MITNSTGRTIGSHELSSDNNINDSNITNQNNIIENDNNKNTNNVTIQDSNTQDSSPSFVIQDADDENDVIYDMDTTKNQILDLDMLDKLPKLCTMNELNLQNGIICNQNENIIAKKGKPNNNKFQNVSQKKQSDCKINNNNSRFPRVSKTKNWKDYIVDEVGNFGLKLSVKSELNGEYAQQTKEAIVDEIKNFLDFQVGHYTHYRNIPLKHRNLNILSTFMFIKHK
jgi:hypothetical protein